MATTCNTCEQLLELREFGGLYEVDIEAGLACSTRIKRGHHFVCLLLQPAENGKEICRVAQNLNQSNNLQVTVASPSP